MINSKIMLYILANLISEFTSKKYINKIIVQKLNIFHILYSNIFLI